MNLLNRDFRQMKIAGQHTPFWGGQHGRFLHIYLIYSASRKFLVPHRVMFRKH